jgi:hypothetical protein
LPFDSRDGFDLVGQLCFGTEKRPVFIIELDHIWSKQLLQRPNDVDTVLTIAELRMRVSRGRSQSIWDETYYAKSA